MSRVRSLFVSIGMHFAAVVSTLTPIRFAPAGQPYIMPKYTVKIQGNNCLLNFEEETELCGFYTTRTVKSSSPEQAEQFAIEIVRNDPELTSMSVESPSIPTYEIVSIEQTYWWTRVGGKGYTFYPMDSE